MIVVLGIQLFFFSVMGILFRSGYTNSFAKVQFYLSNKPSARSQKSFAVLQGMGGAVLGIYLVLGPSKLHQWANSLQGSDRVVLSAFVIILAFGSGLLFWMNRRRWTEMAISQGDSLFGAAIGESVYKTSVLLYVLICAMTGLFSGLHLLSIE